MKSSSWLGQSVRVKKQSKKDWLGCGDRSKKTWSWPLRSVRPTCRARRAAALLPGRGEPLNAASKDPQLFCCENNSSHFNSIQDCLVRCSWALRGFSRAWNAGNTVLYVLGKITACKELNRILRYWKQSFFVLKTTLHIVNCTLWIWLLPDWFWRLQYKFQRKGDKKIFIELAFTCWVYLIIPGRLMSALSMSTSSAQIHY